MVRKRPVAERPVPERPQCLALPKIGNVILCGAVLTHSDQHDGVERAVELSISRPVQSVPGNGPDNASMGAAPPSLAKAASERMRP